ncbi:hypothetical protein [Microbacterium sp. P01]|uniref:hypothetical protein n=1 Tax=unclassified Microbacterium TaxID=2609290 RepID=UPI003670118C
MTFLRILFIAAIAFAAYLLGARAGRARYRHIKKNAKRFWGSSEVRGARKTTRRTAKKLVRAAQR